MLWKPLYLECAAVQVMLGPELANGWNLCLTIRVRAEEINPDQKHRFLDKNGRTITTLSLPMKLPYPTNEILTSVQIEKQTKPIFFVLHNSLTVQAWNKKLIANLGNSKECYPVPKHMSYGRQEKFIE